MGTLHRKQSLTGVETLVWIVGILGSIETVMTARPKIGGLSQQMAFPGVGITQFFQDLSHPF